MGGSKPTGTDKDLEWEEHTADEIESMIFSGKFQQSVHVMAWLLAKDAKSTF